MQVWQAEMWKGLGEGCWGSEEEEVQPLAPHAVPRVLTRLSGARAEQPNNSIVPCLS